MQLAGLCTNLRILELRSKLEFKEAGLKLLLFNIFAVLQSYQFIGVCVCVCV